MTVVDEPDLDVVEDVVGGEWDAAPTELAPDVEHDVADLDGRPIAVEAFAGIGGIALGFERAGFQSAVQIEWDAAASRVLAARFPRAARFGDVRKVDGDAVRRALGGGRARVLSGGFPCQDLSVAGRRAGLAGKRSGLYGELLRLADDLDPDWLVVENVPGLLSSAGGDGDNLDETGHVEGATGEDAAEPVPVRPGAGQRGSDFALFLGDLTGFEPAVPASGWRSSGVCHGPRGTCAWRVLDARYFGVAQRRRRVFVVFHPRDRAAPAAVLLEPEGLRRHPASRVPSWSRPAEGVVGAAVRGRDDGADAAGAGAAPTDVAATLGYATRQPGPDEVAGGQVVGWEAPEEVAPTLLAGPTSPASHGKRSGDDRQALVTRQIGHIEAHGGPDLGSTVTSKWSKGSGGPAGSETPNLIVDGWSSEVAPTLQAGGNDTGGTRPPGTTVDTVESLIVVGDGGEDVTHPVTASGTDGMGRGVPAIAYGVTAKGNGEAYLTDTAPTLASGGGMPGQGYSAVLTDSPAYGVAMRGRAEGNVPEVTEELVSGLRASSGGSTRDLVVPPAGYIVDKERGLPNDEGIRIDPTDVAPTITADGDPAERTDRGLRIPQVYAPDVASTLTSGASTPRAAGGPPARRHEDDHNLVAGLAFNQRDEPRLAEEQAYAIQATPGSDEQLVVQAFRKSRRAATNTDDETWVEADHANTLNTFDGGDARATEVIVEPIPFVVEPESGQGADLLARHADYAPSLTSKNGQAHDRGIRVAYPISQDALRGAGAAETPSADAEGRVRLRDPGLGVYDDGDPSPTVVAAGPPAVGFTQDTRMDTPTEELASPLKIAQHSNVAHPVGVDVLNGDVTGDTAHTVRDGKEQGHPRVIDGPRSAVRRLTPRECERLQGFPDDWTLIPDKNGKPQADSPRYKQLGNAVCATVSEWVGCRILDYDDGTLYLELVLA